MPDKLLIELQYLGPITYYSRLAEFGEVTLEAFENFKKSSYRNRCYIAGPNGRLRLSIPLINGKHQRRLYKEVQIAYDEDWQKNHWNSLCAAYRRSPYFEFYEDHFYPYYHKRYDNLFQFNLELMKVVVDLLELPISIALTQEYIADVSNNAIDERSVIRPNAVNSADVIVYHQVFEDRTGFVPHASIVDLLFNEGPRSKDYLIKN